MLLLAYASVPLYSIFCKATGYGGTTKKVSYSLHTSIDKKIKVLLNADVMPDLHWKFTPELHSIETKIGELSLAFYYVENLSDHSISGIAVYNVAPFQAGKYFNKVACFCFNEQVLLPKQKTVMPVSFVIDPNIMNDPYTKDLDEITLSYTFFKLK